MLADIHRGVGKPRLFQLVFGNFAVGAGGGGEEIQSVRAVGRGGGGSRAGVRSGGLLAVTEAVSVLTGLSSDRITVAKCP